jgi:hypothetical protein
MLSACPARVTVSGVRRGNPKRTQPTRNELYEAILEEFNEHPDRVSFPVGRNR